MRICAASILIVPALAPTCEGCDPDPDPSEIGIVQIDTGASEDTSGAWGHVEFTGGCADPWRLRQVPTAAPIGAWVVRGRVTMPEGWDTGATADSPGPWVYVAEDQANPTITGWTHVEVTCGPVPDPTSQSWTVDVWYPL